MQNNEQKGPEIQNLTETGVPKQSKMKGIAKEIATFIFIAVCIVLPFRIFIAEPYIVDGRSMDPTFSTSDYLIVDKLSYRLHEPKRNTVVVFQYPYSLSKTLFAKIFGLPETPNKSFIKRIIALPGETIEQKQNEVTIYNKEHPEGFKVDQSYVVHEMPANYKITLKDDEYFVMGDNRAESYDSRAWGPLKKKFISGKPILRLLPITEIGLVPGQDDK